MCAVDNATFASELLLYRHLLWSLTWRDIRVRYKQSLLGIAWAILLPFSMMLVFTFVFTRAVDTSSILHIEMPYALFAYTGLVPWTFFSSSLSGCMNSLVGNRNLVTKVYFPREVFPLSCIASSAVDYAVAMLVLIVLGAYFHVTGQWTCRLSEAIVVFPLIVGIQVMLSIGLGMMLAMANLFYRDVRQIFSVAIQLCMFLSAVVVPVPSDGSLLSRVIALNPLVAIFDAYRDCLIYGRWPQAGPLVYAAGVSLLALILGWLVFHRAARRFAESI